MDADAGFAAADSCPEARDDPATRIARRNRGLPGFLRFLGIVVIATLHEALPGLVAIDLRDLRNVRIGFKTPRATISFRSAAIGSLHAIHINFWSICWRQVC